MACARYFFRQRSGAYWIRLSMLRLDAYGAFYQSNFFDAGWNSRVKLSQRENKHEHACNRAFNNAATVGALDLFAKRSFKLHAATRLETRRH